MKNVIITKIFMKNVAIMKIFMKNVVITKNENLFEEWKVVITKIFIKNVFHKFSNNSKKQRE